MSQTSSKGRHGYGTQYKLVASPEMVGPIIGKEWWEDLVKTKHEHESEEPLDGMGFGGFGSRGKRVDNLEKMLNKIKQDKWDNFVGMD
ncbi:MAG: hypothetical protein WCC52_09240 [Nitrosotalea sp.]